MQSTEKDKLEAATFRRLINHLKENPKIQNIDLMELAGFCRNCISRWYSEEAKKEGKNIDYEQARNLIYGMPYNEWKDKYQKEQPKDRIEGLKDKFHKH